MSEENLYRAVLESVPNPLLVFDQEDAIIFANTAAENFFQASLKSLAKKGPRSIIPATSPVLSLMDDVRHAGAIIKEHEVMIGTPKTGGERLCDLQLAPVIDHEGLVVLQVYQRSMAHKIDRQLTHRSAARTVTGMAAMLAHEIKNPLSGIRGAAQLLEVDLDENNLELTGLIISETDRIRDLVNQMEEFSDLRPIHRGPVNIHSVLSHVCKLADSGFARDVKIIERYDPSLPPVLGDRDQLVQVLINLVKNAAEAAAASDKKDGQITITTSFRPGVHLSVRGQGSRVSLPLEVKVANTGAPINPDLMPHLFEPFVTTKPNGKGLGLALTAKIVRDHGGVIECGREHDQTVFTILLPMASETSKETTDGE